MNYNGAIEYIHSVSWRGSKPGLSRTQKLLEKMGNPERTLKFIHVVGTNGKGSFCSMMASILTESGYKTGLYTSPYVLSFNERMKVDSEPISNDMLAEITDYVSNFADNLDESPTEFEIITAIAFEFFKRQSVDIVVLEAGMGGALDSTNVIPSPVLAVFTEIGLDHMQFLGDTVEEIAKTKAGIIKSGCRVLSYANNENAEKEIKAAAERQGCELYNPDFNQAVSISAGLDGLVFDYKNLKAVQLRLAGKYQIRNASAVIEACGVLNNIGYKISEEAIRNGLKNTVWNARFEVLSKTPLIIFDGGHNSNGVTAAVESYKEYFKDKKAKVVMGIMKDKDVSGVLRLIAPITMNMITVTPDNSRAMNSSDLCALAINEGIEADDGGAVANGLAVAINSADKDDVILCIGSLYMYYDVVNTINQI